MSKWKVVVSGPTGLIGSRVVSSLQARADCSVLALGRDRLLAAKETHFWSGTDVYVSCLGTTRAKAGSLAEFRRIDFDLNFELARIAKAAGVKKMILVSASGANSKSLIPYSRIKGELEEALIKLSFEALTILRPSLLLGERRERRRVEGLAQAMLGQLKLNKLKLFQAWAPVEATLVSREICRQVFAKHPGIEFVENQDFFRPL